MSQIKTITGTGIPLEGQDIDTDRIIPARFLRCVTFDGLEKQVFADDRKQAQGQHPFDLDRYQNAKILVVNRNFGCGSSREHAPQAIARWGIQAIVGESFAEIFFGNCVANGVPCLTAAAETIQQLQDALTQTPRLALQVSLDTMILSYQATEIPLAMAAGPRQMLLTGTWDTCSQLVSHREQIKATAAQLPYLAWRPLTTAQKS